mmetsp:Transcript_59705/g.177643  ORF Transcript_59705/g.177643 Transcript_59705/m.177643 type:complete len:260 (+) Transcript_59705:351-1130(+)
MTRRPSVWRQRRWWRPCVRQQNLRGPLPSCRALPRSRKAAEAVCLPWRLQQAQGAGSPAPHNRVRDALAASPRGPRSLPSKRGCRPCPWAPRRARESGSARCAGACSFGFRSMTSPRSRRAMRGFGPVGRRAPGPTSRRPGGSWRRARRPRSCWQSWSARRRTSRSSGPCAECWLAAACQTAHGLNCPGAAPAARPRTPSSWSCPSRNSCRSLRVACQRLPSVPSEPAAVPCSPSGTRTTSGRRSGGPTRELVSRPRRT